MRIFRAARPNSRHALSPTSCCRFGRRQAVRNSAGNQREKKTRLITARLHNWVLGRLTYN